MIILIMNIFITKNMSNLIFLGAGASRAFCISTMQEMVTDFEKIISNDDKECFEFYLD